MKEAGGSSKLVPLHTAGESVFYRRSDGSLVPATVLGPGAQCETVQIEYKRNERLVRHPAALIANLSRPIPTIPDSPDWDSAPSRSPSPPPRTRPTERSAKRRPRHSAPPSVRPVQIQPEITNFFSAAPVQKQTEITNFFGPNVDHPMHVGRHTTAQSAEIHSFGAHLSTWLTVGAYRALCARCARAVRKVGCSPPPGVR